MAKREMSEQAKAAKMIRAHLKANGIKARVISDSASMTNSVRVTLTDELAPTVEKVEEFAKQFQQGHFDGMDDSYHYSNRRDDLPQVQFVFVYNELSEETRADVWAYCQTAHANASDHDRPYTHEDHVLFSGAFRGDWGTWLSDRKPRARAGS